MLRLIKRLLSPLFVFAASCAGLILAAGIFAGYYWHGKFGRVVGEVKVAINDFRSNPLHLERKFDHPPGLTYFSEEKDPGFLLLSGYFLDDEKSGVRLVRLSDGAVLKKWYPDPAAIRAASSYKRFSNVDRFIANTPLLEPDGGLEFIDGQGPLVRIDACSRIEWVADGHYHHSLEHDLDGNLLVPGIVDWQKSQRYPYKFRNDAIARVSPDGKLIDAVSVADILFENGLCPLFLASYPGSSDPVHLNDIEVAETDGNVWKRGDYLVSLRTLHLVFIYRPSTKKIVWHQAGPWVQQHDPDYLPDGGISVYGNDVLHRNDSDATLITGHNDIYLADPITHQVATPFTAVMAKANIGSITRGKQRILANGDAFLEESNFGRLARMSPDGLKWIYYNANEDVASVLNWSRYLTADEVAKADLSRDCSR